MFRFGYGQSRRRSNSASIPNDRHIEGTLYNQGRDVVPVSWQQCGRIGDKMRGGPKPAVASSLFERISNTTRSSLTSSREFKATVQLMDDEETIQQEFKKAADAQHVMDYVCEYLNIVENDYFGLRYVDASKHRYWVDLNKPVAKQVRGPNIGLRFRVRFYPSDVTVVKEELTRYQLFAQLQRDLLHGRLCCPQAEAAELGGLILQSLIGNYDPEKHEAGYVSQYHLLLKQTEKIEEKIAQAHRTFKGLTSAEAEMAFLKRASKLETYGFDPFAVGIGPSEHRMAWQVYVGVTHRGVHVYQNEMIHHIPWNELEKVDYVGKALLITPIASYVPTYRALRTTDNDTYHRLSMNSHLGGGTTRATRTIKLYCPSGTFVKHLWRHILSQQAFFTENDAKHIKPKFSKSRIPIFSRGSTFRFATGRVLHEIEQDTANRTPRPEPNFTRYALKRQPPRQRQISASSYHTMPQGNHINDTTTEDGPILEEEEGQEEENVLLSLSAPARLEHSNSNADVLEVTPTAQGCSKDGELDSNVTREELVLSPPVKWLSPAQKTTFTIHLSRTEELSSAAGDPRMNDTMLLDESGNSTASSLQPVCTSTPVRDKIARGNRQQDDANETIAAQLSFGGGGASSSDDTGPIVANIQTVKVTGKRGGNLRTVVVLNVLFSFLLMAILVIAVVIALFENRPTWLESSETAELVRHEAYEPLRAYLLSVYERLFASG